MLDIIFAILMVLVFGKLFLFGLKASWGIFKFLLTILLLPVSLIIMFMSGLMYLAFLIVLVMGIFSFLGSIFS